MKTIKWLVLALPAVLFIGCASPAKQENMVYRPQAPLSYDSALYKGVNLQNAAGGQKTNPMWTSEISTEAFSEAVKSTLEEEGLFSENGRYQLAIEMQKTDQPMFGMNLTVTTYVNYVLTDSSNSTVILNETITAPYTATVGDSFAAIKRLRLANEGSGKENIKGLLEKLSALKINPNQVSLVK